jgi:hypothetical protein
MSSSYTRKRTHPDQRIAAIAAVQHGVFTRLQASRCGATDTMIDWRLRVGRWRRLHRGIYALAGSAKTWRQAAIAASLLLDAPLSFRAAAALARLRGFKPNKIELTVRRNRHHSSPAGVILHWSRNPIPDDDIMTIEGIPVTRPARTLLDLATVEPERVIERALDDCLRRKLVSVPVLQGWLADPKRKRHRGARVLQRLVDVRATRGVTDSELETDVLQLLHDAGLPMPMLQYEIWEGDRLLGRVDFAYPNERVAIEAESFEWHEGRQPFDHDRARGNDILALGWQVLRVTSTHIKEDPEGVVAWVRSALGLV